MDLVSYYFFFFQAEDGIRDIGVTGVQTCALPIWRRKCRDRDLLPRWVGSNGGWIDLDWNETGTPSAGDPSNGSRAALTIVGFRLIRAARRRRQSHPRSTRSGLVRSRGRDRRDGNCVAFLRRNRLSQAWHAS